MTMPARLDLGDQTVDPAAALGIGLGRGEGKGAGRRAGGVAVGLGCQRAEGLGRALEEAGRQQQAPRQVGRGCRSEEHTSELPSLMRISYAVFCLKTNKIRL